MLESSNLELSDELEWLKEVSLRVGDPQPTHPEPADPPLDPPSIPVGRPRDHNQIARRREARICRVSSEIPCKLGVCGVVVMRTTLTN